MDWINQIDRPRSDGTEKLRQYDVGVHAMFQPTPRYCDVLALSFNTSSFFLAGFPKYIRSLYEL